MADYVVPQALIHQEFRLQPTALARPLRACPLGPQYALFRYSDSDEKPAIRVTSSYNPDADEAFAWPGRPAGGVVDTDYTGVYMDDALLEYYSDPGGDGSEIRAVSGYRNRIRFDALVLKTANGFSRSGVFLDRDVAPGDMLDIIATACGEPYDIRTQILSLVADEVAAVISAPEDDPDNQPARSETETNSFIAGDENDVVIESVDVTTYDGREDGQVEETYTVVVTQPSTGGDAETARLEITRQSDGTIFSDVQPGDFGDTADPTVIDEDRDLTAVFNNTAGSSSWPVDADDFLIGQTWQITVSQDFTPPTVASDGVYLGAADTTYIVRITKGGDVGDAEFTVSTTTGIDASGPTVISALGTALPVGTQGTTVTFSGATEGFCLDDVFTIDVTAVTEGAVKTVVVATPLPAAVRGICLDSSSSSSSGTPADLAVTFYIKADIEVPENRVGFAPLVNWEQSETEITLKSGIIAYDATWTNAGVLQPLNVKDGIVYINYRALVRQWVDTVGTIDDVSLIPDTFDDAPIIDQDNPLVFGVYNTLLNCDGEDVKFTGIGASSPIELEDWLAALQVLRGRDDVYSLVPLTFDKQVIDAVVSHVEAMSTAEEGRWRIAWFSQQAETELGIYTVSEALGREGEVVLATITDDPDTSGTQYTLVSASGEKFITGDNPVSAGMILRAQYQDDGFGNITYSEYVIDDVLNDEELRLHTGPDVPINTPSKIEVWENLNKTQIATNLATKPGLWNSRRAYLVWPDEIGNAGETVPGYYLCCSLAGLRSASLPHRGLTNAEVIGWDDLTRTTQFFNEPQLDTMAGAGWWIVTQAPDGDVYTRHQLSTNNLDLNRREQSVTTNVDSISYLLLDRLAPYIGRGNVTPTMVNIVEGVIRGTMDYFADFVVQDELGPQVLSYEVAELRQHPLLADRILARIPTVIPYPFNNAEVYLII